MPTFNQRLTTTANLTVSFNLLLTASERSRARHRFETEDGIALFLRLPRGTTLQDGDLLQGETGQILRIGAKPEPVLTVTAKKPLDLLRAAYHLGNRHVSLEIAPNYLRLSRDPVLQRMLSQMGLEVQEEVLPFFPELGAYGHSHRSNEK